MIAPCDIFYFSQYLLFIWLWNGNFLCFFFSLFSLFDSISSFWRVYFRLPTDTHSPRMNIEHQMFCEYMRKFMKFHPLKWPFWVILVRVQISGCLGGVFGGLPVCRSQHLLFSVKPSAQANRADSFNIHKPCIEFTSTVSSSHNWNERGEEQTHCSKRINRGK